MCSYWILEHIPTQVVRPYNPNATEKYLKYVERKYMCTENMKLSNTTSTCIISPLRLLSAWTSEQITGVESQVPECRGDGL
jgi:hypothetical protein